MKTEITDLLGIEYPIIQGGMAWVADAQLAAAVTVVPAAVAQVDRRDVIFGIDPEMRAVCAAPAERADGQHARLIDHTHAESPTGDGVAVRRLRRDVGRGQKL